MPPCPGTTRPQGRRASSTGGKRLKGLCMWGENKGKQNTINYSSHTWSEAHVYAASEADELATERDLPGPTTAVSVCPAPFIRPLPFSPAAGPEAHGSSSRTLSAAMGGLSWKNKQGAQSKESNKGTSHSASRLRRQCCAQRRAEIPLLLPSGSGSPERAGVSLDCVQSNGVFGEGYGIVCSHMQCNLSQSKFVSSQVRNYRERRRCGFYLFIWFKYVVSARISCQMENVGWEVLKKETVPWEESPVPQHKIHGSPVSFKALSRSKPDSLQIQEKLLCITFKSLH